VSTPAEDAEELASKVEALASELAEWEKAMFISRYVQFAHPDAYAEALSAWNARKTREAQ
jgi:hypothetical protein